MSDQLFLAAIIGPMLLTLGLSVLIYSDVWKKIGDSWQKDHLSLLSIMVFNLVFGLVVISMHNVWEWSPYLIITLVGWAAFLKSVIYFLVPGNHLGRMIKAVNCKCYYQTAGVVFSILGAWLSYLVYLA